jgi:hypothetical protein
MKTIIVINLSRDRFTCEIDRTLPFTVTDLHYNQVSVSEDENLLGLIEPGVEQAIFTAEWRDNELILIGRLLDAEGSAPMSGTVH